MLEVKVTLDASERLVAAIEKLATALEGNVPASNNVPLPTENPTRVRKAQPAAKAAEEPTATVEAAPAPAVETEAPKQEAAAEVPTFEALRTDAAKLNSKNQPALAAALKAVGAAKLTDLKDNSEGRIKCMELIKKALAA